MTYLSIKKIALGAALQARNGTLQPETVERLKAAAAQLPDEEELAAAIAGFLDVWPMRFQQPAAMESAGQALFDKIHHLNLAEVGEQAEERAR